VHRFNQATNNTEACFQNLRGKGYQIAVTALHAETVSLYDLDLSRKTAVVMGTELTGASAVAMKMADVYISIPTYGFTESLNVSAASSVIMANMIERIRREDRPWQLTAEEQLDLKIQWAKKSIYWSKYIVDMYESGELS
jgi:tRNA (guanosine-2'-O-)-methyltransferase